MAEVRWGAASAAAHVWPVGALCRAIADALEARFNPVTVSGEISGFSRATSGHCYFSLKDDSGQLRCAMFRRAASQLQFSPRDGDRVEVRGRLGVYEPRGDLQLVVETMSRAGAGTLFEQFLVLKEKLEKEGLFDQSRKRALPSMPRGIGLVTSLGAAALHDVVTALQRRVPHIPVVLAPASVQGEGAAAELVRALESLYQIAEETSPEVQLDAILLVRGGGALEDLWSFNDENLARVIARSPVPVVCGVGHETDFTIADFVADVRAPTPTAAAELVSISQQESLQEVAAWAAALQRSVQRIFERHFQSLDRLGERVSRPSVLAAQQGARLDALAHRMRQGLRANTAWRRQALQDRALTLPKAAGRAVSLERTRLSSAEVRLHAIDPHKVLQRGFAWITDSKGQALTRVGEFQAGNRVRATLADGTVDLTVAETQRN